MTTFVIKCSIQHASMWKAEIEEKTIPQYQTQETEWSYEVDKWATMGNLRTTKVPACDLMMFDKECYSSWLNVTEYDLDITPHQHGI